MNENTEVKMDDFLSKAEKFLNRIEVQNELQKQQLEMYKERQEQNEEILKRQYDLHEARWRGIRQMIIGVAGVLITFLITSGIAIEKRPTEAEVDEKLKEYPTKMETLRGFGSVIDNVFDADIEDIESRDKAEDLSSKAKEDVLKEILPEYRTRSIKSN